jgi:hypothetical protein
MGFGVSAEDMTFILGRDYTIECLFVWEGRKGGRKERGCRGLAIVNTLTDLGSHEQAGT